MEKEGKFLPIGTVVLLKGGKKEVMILSYGLMPQGDIVEDGKQVSGLGKIYDYGGCTYPEGLISSNQILGFNHEQIERICYKGYSTPTHDEYNKMLTASFDELKEDLKKINTKQSQESEAQA